jgi:hypothetical protein
MKLQTKRGKAKIKTSPPPLAFSHIISPTPPNFAHSNNSLPTPKTTDYFGKCVRKYLHNVRQLDVSGICKQCKKFAEEREMPFLHFGLDISNTRCQNN